MAWVELDTNGLLPGEPYTSEKALAMFQNVEAAFSGDSGAPRLVNGAVTNGTLGAEKFQTGATERDWVLERIAAASAPSLGTYILAEGAEGRSAGDIVSGSLIQYAGASRNVAGNRYQAVGGAALAGGSWRCMGDTGPGSTVNEQVVTLWLRVA